MDYNQLGRNQDGMEMPCRNCARYPMEEPYENWQQRPWQEMPYENRQQRPRQEMNNRNWQNMPPQNMPWREQMPMPGIERPINRPGFGPVPGYMEGMPMQPDTMWPMPMQPDTMWSMPMQPNTMQPMPMQPDTMQPMPYHMAYPYPMFMQETADDERDLERLVSMFPETARRIQPIVEEECDRMEYDGSLMFDEYPDKVMIERVIEKIYDKMENADQQEMTREEEAVFATQCRNCQNRSGDGVRDLISVILFEEMHRRRCRHRRCKRWW